MVMEKLKGRIVTLAMSSSIIISALLSSYSIYIEKKAYMVGSEMYVQTSIFLILGFIVSSGFWLIEDKIKQHKNWYFSVLLAILISVAWLSVSPRQNALAFNNREAVVQEIKEQYKVIEGTVTPFIDRYNSYKGIANNLINIQQTILEMKIKQAESGRGKFYHMLNNMDTQLSPLINDFTSQYNRRNDKRIKRIKKNLLRLSALENMENDDDMLYGSIGLVQEYNKLRFKLQNDISILKDAEDPSEILTNILARLKEFQQLVYSVRDNPRTNATIKKIAMQTSQTIDTLLIQFEHRVKIANAKIQKNEKILNNIDKITFDSIILNVTLVDKHWKQYYSSYIGVQLLDYIPIAFMFFRIFLIIRDRKIISLRDKRDRLENKKDKKVVLLEKINDCKTKACKTLRKLEKSYDEKVNEKRLKLDELENNYNKEMEEIKDTILDTKLQYSKNITNLDQNESIKRREAGDDYSLLQDIKEDFETLRGNADTKFDEDISLLQNKLDDLARNYKTEKENIEEEYQDSLEKLKLQIDEASSKRKTRIDNVESEIEELEEEVEELELEIEQYNKQKEVGNEK